MATKAPVSRALLTSAARTATVSTADQPNLGHSGVHVVIRVTALAATPAVTPTIEGWDVASQTWYTLLAGTTITDVTVGSPPQTTVLKVAPGITPSPNAAAADYLPAIWRVTMTHGDTDSITYSVGANLVS